MISPTDFMLEPISRLTPTNFVKSQRGIDVYKRQTCGWQSPYYDEYGTQPRTYWYGDADGLSHGGTPVSYTHLDVYKRQSVYRSRPCTDASSTRSNESTSLSWQNKGIVQNKAKRMANKRFMPVSYTHLHIPTLRYANHLRRHAE